MESAKFEIFNRTSFFRKVRWYWRLKAPNGEIVAVGAEPFDSHSNTVRAIETMKLHSVASTIEFVGDGKTKSNESD